MTNDPPTPEQQEATARRYQGQRALLTPELVQEAVNQPVAPTAAGEASGGFKGTFWHYARLTTLLTIIGLAVAAFVAHQVNNRSNTGVVPAYPLMYPVAHRATIVLGVAAVILVVFWFLIGLGWYLRLVWRTTGEAMKPVPSLAAIEQQLRAEGYDSSITDVVALHQYLTSQRNEAAFFAGALVIGPQLLSRQAQGKPLL